MQGKKFNLDYFHNFILKCCRDNKETPTQIIESAKDKISKIDKKIKKIDNLVKEKDNLLQVIESFENKSKRIDILDLFKVLPDQITFDVIKLFADKKSFNLNIFDSNQLELILKLKNIKVLSVKNNFCFAGVKYQDYCNFVLGNVNVK